MRVWKVFRDYAVLQIMLLSLLSGCELGDFFQQVHCLVPTMSYPYWEREGFSSWKWIVSGLRVITHGVNLT